MFDCEDPNPARQRALKIAVPVGVVLGMIYFSWVYAQHICWNEVYQHHSKSTGIGLIVGNCLLITLVFFIWIQILVIGPGIQPRVPVFRIIKDETSDFKSIDPPAYFFCDENGYPVWCSQCQTIKANRTHHSSDMGQCVAKFDHHCTWIGGSIGKRNYRLFIQFLFWYCSYFIFAGVSGAVYMKSIKRRRGSINGNLIAMFVADAFWVIMIFALFASHILYISRNISAIDDIITKRHRKNRSTNDKFMSVAYNGERYVMRINPDKDYIWNKGFITNWKEYMGSNVLFWIIPWGTTIKNAGDPESEDYYTILGDFNEEIGEKWRNLFIERIKNGDYVIKA